MIREFSHDSIPRRVVVTVDRVKGKCGAGLKVGDKFVCEGENLKLKESDKVCLAAFNSIYPMILTARLGLNIEKLGLENRIV